VNRPTRHGPPGAGKWASRRTGQTPEKGAEKYFDLFSLFHLRTVPRVLLSGMTKTNKAAAKSETYIKFFSDEGEASSWMRMRNQARLSVGNRDIFAVVDGPEDNFAVVDLRTAIELGGGYRWEV
jgi:hypothetical protein